MSTTVKSTDDKKPTEWVTFQKRIRTLTGISSPDAMKLCSYLKKIKDMNMWQDSEITETLGRWRISLEAEVGTEEPKEEKKPKEIKEEKESKEIKQEKESKVSKEPKKTKVSKEIRLADMQGPIPSGAYIAEGTTSSGSKENNKEKASTVVEPPATSESISSLEFHLLEAKKKVITATDIAKKAEEDAKKAVEKAEDAMKKALDLKAKAALATAAATDAQALIITSQKEVDVRTAEFEKASAAIAVAAVPETDTTDNEPLHLKRKKIPKHVKTLVWNKYIGSDIAEAPCVSCRTAKISNRSFNCGHVIAESKGGDLTINNLRPICTDCNGSMGTMSMNEFTKQFFGWTV